MTLDPRYDPLLVTLSVAVSFLGAYVGLGLAGQIAPANPRDRPFWIGCAAFAIGGGAIWSMHFIGMVALDLGIAVGYDWLLTAASLLLAIGVTAGGLALAARDGPPALRFLPGGTAMGAGIALMHYTGMAASRMPATISYDAALVGASLAIAMGASITALWLSFHCRRGRQLLGGSAILAIAVSGMHYTAMAAATFTTIPTSISPPAISGTTLAYAVFLITLVVLALELALTRELRGAAATGETM